jgi:hypothetical protein
LFWRILHRGVLNDANLVVPSASDGALHLSGRHAWHGLSYGGHQLLPQNVAQLAAVAKCFVEPLYGRFNGFCLSVSGAPYEKDDSWRCLGRFYDRSRPCF